MSKNFNIRLTPDGELEASADCEVTGTPYTIKASYAGYNSWKAGMSVQDALPELTEDQQDFLMFQTTPAEWEKTVAETEDNPCTCCGSNESSYCDCNSGGCSVCNEDLL